MRPSGKNRVKPSPLWAVIIGLAMVHATALAVERSDGRRAILIGVSHYDNRPPGLSSNLEGPRNDVAAMRDVLVMRWGFSPQEIITLVDEAARKPQVLSALKEAEAWAGPDKVLLLYFSGHGVGSRSIRARYPLPDDTGALVLAPPPGGARNRVQEQYLVGFTELRPILQSIDRKGARIFAMFDACFSQFTFKGSPLQGRYFRSGREDDLLLPPDAVDMKGSSAERSPYAAAFYVSAAAANETAQDIRTADLVYWPTVDGRAHGAFTDAVLRVLLGRVRYIDRDRNGVMSNGEFFEAVQSFMATCSYGHSPFRLPGKLYDQGRIADRDFLDVQRPGTIEIAEPPAALRVSFADTDPALAARLRRLPGITSADQDVELIVRRQAAGSSLHAVFDGAGNAILLDARKDVWFQYPDEVERQLRIRGRMRQLENAAAGASRQAPVEVGFADPAMGTTVQRGDIVELKTRADADVSIFVLHVASDGQVTLQLPAPSGGGACEGTPRMRANQIQTLCRFEVTPLFGLDTLYVLALGEGSDIAPCEGRCRSGEALLDHVERLLETAHGGVTLQRFPLFSFDKK